MLDDYIIETPPPRRRALMANAAKIAGAIGFAALVYTCANAEYRADRARNEELARACADSVPQKFVGFDDNFTPVSADIPTEGVVIRVWQLPNETYMLMPVKGELGKGDTAKLVGRFEYQIAPFMRADGSYVPNDGTGCSSSQLRDVREGSVTGILK
jgi:hypothetical protein